MPGHTPGVGGKAVKLEFHDSKVHALCAEDDHHYHLVNVPDPQTSLSAMSFIYVYPC